MLIGCSKDNLNFLKESDYCKIYIPLKKFDKEILDHWEKKTKEITEKQAKNFNLNIEEKSFVEFINFTAANEKKYNALCQK